MADNNTTFEDYLKRYCKKHNISEEEAKTHKLIKTIDAYYKGRSKTNVH